MAYCINRVLEVLKIKTMLTLVEEEITCKLQKAASCMFNKLYLLSIVSTVIKQQQQRQPDRGGDKTKRRWREG